MSDFFREVDEEVRRDRIFQVWRRYSGWIIGAALLLVIGVAGWRFNEYRVQKAAEAASARLDAALKAAREDRGEDAEKDLAAIIKDAPAGYQLIARFRLAAATGKRDTGEGARLFDAIGADAAVDPALRDLAKLRAAMLRIDDTDYAALRGSLEPLAVPAAPWRHTARELLGVSALKSGDLSAAARWFDQIASDRETPAALRQRADRYMALVTAGPVPKKP
jgi:hypothetical protein